MLINLRETSLLCLLLCSASVVATVEGDAEKHDIAALAKEWATSGEPQLPLPSTSGGVSARIVNGNDAPQSRFGYAVSLQSYGFHFCGGSLIGKFSKISKFLLILVQILPAVSSEGLPCAIT